MYTHTSHHTQETPPSQREAIFLLAKVPFTVFHDSNLKNSYLFTTSFCQSRYKKTLK